MAKNDQKSVLVDTSFLISLFDNSKDDEGNFHRPNHPVALKYYKYFLKHNIKMQLSTIVVSEFHQVQSVADILSSGHFLMLPYNFDDAIAAADVCYNLGGMARRDTANIKYKDDLKLMGQAKNNSLDYIITEDKATLARYCEKLSDINMFDTKVIVLKDGFNTSLFNNGQTAFIEVLED